MNLIRTFVSRPVTTTMMVLVFVVLGLISYQRLSLELYPDVDFPFALITMVYPGAAPEEIESQMVKKIEDAISNISDIKHVTSTANENYATTFVEFNFGVDIDIKALDLKDKVEAITNDLPADAEKVLIEKFDPLTAPTLEIVLSSDNMSLNEIYEYADGVLKDKFSQVSGVAKVDVLGGRERQINVKVDMAKLLSYRLSLFDLLSAIQTANLDIPAGSIDKGEFEMGIRLKGQFESIEDIGNLPIYLTDKMSPPEIMSTRAAIKLKDVATIRDGFEEITSEARYNGKETVILSVYKQSGGNVVNVADETYRKLEEIKPLLPAGLEAQVINDTTRFIRESMADAQGSILLGILLTAIILYLFLGDIRIALVAVVVIPTSIISAFLVMQLLGFTLNLLSLMALGVSIGALVANAIVIIENIHKHMEKHDDPLEGTVRGTSEVIVAVMASAGTNIVVFVPIAFMGGIMGQFFYPFGMTVVAATIFSLIASFSLTPMLSYFAFRGKKPPKGLFDKPLALFDRFIEACKREYMKALEFTLRWRKTTVMVSVVVLFSSLYVMQYVGGEGFPREDTGDVTISAELPQGATIEASRSVMDRIEQIIATVPELKEYSSTVGGDNIGLNEMTFNVKLVSIDERDRSDKRIAESLIGPLSKIPAIEFTVEAGDSGGQAGDMTIEIYGPDYDELIAVSEQFKAVMYETGNFLSITSSYKQPKQEMRFVPDPFKTGIHAGDNYVLGATLRTAIEGNDVSVLRQDGQEYDINLSLADHYVDSPNELGAILVPLDKDQLLTPISQLGEFQPAFAESSIYRKDKERMIELTCFIGRLSMTEIITILDQKFAAMDLKPGYRYKYGGDVEIQKEAMASTQEAFLIATILTLMLLAAILNSFVHPFTIFLTIPLGAGGVFYTLFFSGLSMNMMPMMAMVMLVGIVVNSAILIVDQAYRDCQTGVEPLAAVRQACEDKFRAILMTNIAIVFGLLPQAMGGADAVARASIAMPTIGGVIMATIFTLFLIPVVFYYMERLRTLPARLLARKS